MNLREMSRAAWRWPLYSRARAVATAAVAFSVVIVVPQLDGTTSAAGAASGSSSVASSALSRQPSLEVSPMPGTQSAGITAAGTGESAAEPTPETTRGKGTIGPDRTVSVDLPDQTPGSATENTLTEDSPTDVATSWLQRWCTTRAEQAGNDNIRSARALMTSTAYTAELRAGVTADSWARTQKAGLSTTCKAIRVETPDSAPEGATSRWVVLTAQQITYGRSGSLVSSNAITQTRKLVQNSAGRWLVDQQVQAG